MEKQVKDRLILEDISLIFRNLSGARGQYNAEGDRNFSILLDDAELADSLANEGWNVRPLTLRDPEDEQHYHLSVKVDFKGFVPPQIYSVRKSGKMLLTPDTVAMLDYLPLEGADVVLNPYNWEVNGNTGCKAYCHQLFARISETELDLKYSDIPDVVTVRDVD